jgi:PAS domain S-box-containing protein
LSSSGSPLAAQTVVAILESISDAVISLDREWCCTYLNAAAERFTRRRREDLLGRTCWEIFPAMVGTQFEDTCRRAMDEGVTVRFHEYQEPSNKWFQWTAYPTDAGIVVHTRDITDWKRAPAARRESEEGRRYFELGLVGMAITSPSKGILDINEKICEILGYERSELLQMTWAELTHPDDLDADVAHFNRVLANEIDGYSLNKRWIRKDGHIVDSTISVKCLRRSDSSVDHFVALLKTIASTTARSRISRSSPYWLNEP